MDTSNPVVVLCAQGMEAEGRGDAAAARELFHQAWDASGDHFERCVAAHYVARHAAQPDEILSWNERALHHADLVGDDRVRGFYASLWFNLGRSHEQLGAPDRARDCYRRAASHMPDVPDGPYKDMIQRGLNGAADRLGGPGETAGA